MQLSDVLNVCVFRTNGLLVDNQLGTTIKEPTDLDGSQEGDTVMFSQQMRIHAHQAKTLPMYLNLISMQKKFSSGTRL